MTIKQKSEPENIYWKSDFDNSKDDTPGKILLTMLITIASLFPTPLLCMFH